MSFASNVQMTTLTTSDVAITGRTRLNGLYYTCGSTASTIDLYNGDAVSGDPLVSIVTPAVAGAQNVIIPDGGVLFSDGIYADLGALLIAIFLIPTAFMMHAFWKETDATAKMNETIGFFKDLSLAGAALIIYALVAGGAELGINITKSFF